MPLRINFTHCHGVGFYEVAPASKRDLAESAHKLPRWVVLKPVGIAWLKLPEAQADHWETAACKLTGLTSCALSGVAIEIHDMASGRVVPLVSALNA